VVAVVQARTGSRRLPGKVLADLAGQPLILRVLERAAAARGVDHVVLATSDLARDDELAGMVADAGWAVHRGDEQDVLRRFRDAADHARADIVVRITGDCPLADPDVIATVVDRVRDPAQPCDLASNALRRTFPKGLDAEALYIDVLHRTDRLARSPEAREHVTWFAYRERPDLFLLASVENDDDAYASVNWSVDEEADLQRVRDLYARFGLAERTRPWTDLL
jgi:spore coat polysaccharide biosynthesis protein SpsF (cytidylyltransferase family)